ncbi:hypothetical protein GYMLUDRAFT_250327 [Collybiopsis luxurians FD-317 M1]|uniref:Uncharacterized protein n=1 Tax=Collybiopsis luxurians FD-317 M1 TaxID=944289 RepID=A0A0D0CF07_9AGAR|nr:hypothetical protein GYMLUDRAFT_250327 [Collybiopsis luxurians FD-317 M1]
MPLDDPERLHYQQIEDMAKTLGWDRAEAYFTNIEDESGPEMDRQLNPDSSVAIWMAQLKEMGKSFSEIMKHAPKEGPESEKVDPFRVIAKAPEEDIPLSERKSMFVQKKVTFDGVLMPPVNSNQVLKSTTGKD